VQRLREADSFDTQFVEVSRDAGDVVGLVSRFLEVSSAFIEKTAERVQFERAQAASADRVPELERELQETLRTLERELELTSPEAV
jgi:hypothetical protein